MLQLRTRLLLLQIYFPLQLALQGWLCSPGARNRHTMSCLIEAVLSKLFFKFILCVNELTVMAPSLLSLLISAATGSAGCTNCEAETDAPCACDPNS